MKLPRKKTNLRARQQKDRERRLIKNESTQEREARQRANRERSLRRREAESTQERETRQQTDHKEKNQGREAESTLSVLECEPARRPSRRAAIVASEKISSTVSNYHLKEHHDFNANASVPPKPPVKKEKAQRGKSPMPPPTPGPPIEISLDMECEEEILSETQAETLSKAQSLYNLMMKGLRELVQCNVKVKFVDIY